MRLGLEGNTAGGLDLIEVVHGGNVLVDQHGIRERPTQAYIRAGDALALRLLGLPAAEMEAVMEMDGEEGEEDEEVNGNGK